LAGGGGADSFALAGLGLLGLAAMTALYFRRPHRGTGRHQKAVNR
jgi:hypothetical protein